jgi:hypothetical protein
MKRTAKLLNLLLSDFACVLANKLLPAPVAPENDKKATPIIFLIRRWRMGEGNKMCLALGSVCLLLGCAAPLQETTQIQCTSRDGQILYAGPYDDENAPLTVQGLSDMLRNWNIGRLRVTRARDEGLFILALLKERIQELE